MGRSFIRLVIALGLCAGGTLLAATHGQGQQNQPGDAAQEVEATLTGFLKSFVNGDLEAMEASLADDSVTFPRAIMSKTVTGTIRPEDYRRVRGLDAEMRALVAQWRASGAAPPYATIEPKDVKVQLFAEVAVVTFHREGRNSVARRTFVFAKQKGSWKIVHHHASDVVGSE